MFTSSCEKKLVTLKEYVSRMREDQKSIYYACGSSIDSCAMLPQTEAVLDKGYEVLYLTDDVDEFALRAMNEYDGKSFVNVCDQSLDISDDSEKERIKEQNEQNSQVLSYMKEALGESVGSVRLSASLKNHPVCISSEGGISLEMEKVLNAMPDSEGSIKAHTVLEINAAHPICDKLIKLYQEDKDKLASYTKILYAQARLISGMSIDNPTELSDLVCSLMI